MTKATLVKSADIETTEFDWGKIEFFASDVVGPAEEQSLGRATIYPGKALPKHYHTLCSEVIHVTKGTVTHTIEDDEVATLQVGDTVIVPRHFRHQARNVGEANAELIISFSAPKRDFIVVD